MSPGERDAYWQRTAANAQQVNRQFYPNPFGPENDIVPDNPELRSPIALATAAPAAPSPISAWQSAERVQKNEAGEYRALIGGKWVPVAKAQKNEAGEFRVMPSGMGASGSVAERVANDPISVGARNFTQDQGNYGPFQIPSGLANTMAGFYKGARDLGMGLEQMTSPGRIDELRQKVAEQRQLDAPLMTTGAGKAGELGFNVASILPTLAIPGVNTVSGAAALGGAFGLAQPSTSTLETAPILASERRWEALDRP